MKSSECTAPKISIQEWCKILQADRESQREHWRKNWFSIILHGLFTCGGGFVFGVALGLSAFILGMTQALSRY